MFRSSLGPAGHEGIGCAAASDGAFYRSSLSSSWRASNTYLARWTANSTNGSVPEERPVKPGTKPYNGIPGYSSTGPGSRTP
jgi:hypothetical protein